MPRRLQQSRRAGARKPKGARVVSRPSKWGNPWRVGDVVDGVTLDRAAAVSLYREYIVHAMATERGQVELNLETLRGKDLCCWCPVDGQPCHADVLLELANA